VTIAEKLLRGRGTVPAAAGLIEPLQKAAQTTANADLAKRAQELAKQAQAKAKRQ
jgi:hypothetical protein